MKGVTIRLPENVLRGIAREARATGATKGAVVREALMTGLAQRKEDRLAASYAARDISEEEICRELGISRWEFSDFLNRRRLHRNLSLEDHLDAVGPVRGTRKSI